MDDFFYEELSDSDTLTCIDYPEEESSEDNFSDVEDSSFLFEEQGSRRVNYQRVLMLDQRISDMLRVYDPDSHSKLLRLIGKYSQLVYTGGLTNLYPRVEEFFSAAWASDRD